MSYQVASKAPLEPYQFAAPRKTQYVRREPSGVRFSWSLPWDVADRLHAVADLYDVGWQQLAVAIICEWIGQNAPYAVRPPGDWPWWDRTREVIPNGVAVEERPDDAKPYRGKRGPRGGARLPNPPFAEIRMRRGYTTLELARYAGVSPYTVRCLEKGGAPMKRVTVGQLVKVADALGVAVVDLIPGFKYSPKAWRKREAKVRPGEEHLAAERGAVVAEREID
jgi:transcriptional regulator with XRE-family HTH domain